MGSGLQNRLPVPGLIPHTTADALRWSTAITFALRYHQALQRTSVKTTFRKRRPILRGLCQPFAARTMLLVLIFTVSSDKGKPCARSPALPSSAAHSVRLDS